MPEGQSDAHPLDGLDDEQLARILAIADEYESIINQGGVVTGFNEIDDGTPEPTDQEKENALLALAALKRLRDERQS